MLTEISHTFHNLKSMVISAPNEHPFKPATPHRGLFFVCQKIALGETSFGRTLIAAPSFPV